MCEESSEDYKQTARGKNETKDKIKAAKKI